MMTYHCDREGCERHCSEAAMQERPFLTVMGDGSPLYFCGWDCLLKHAATFEPETVIPMDGPDA